MAAEVIGARRPAEPIRWTATGAGWQVSIREQRRNAINPACRSTFAAGAAEMGLGFV
jgi:hypothetical protein